MGINVNTIITENQKPKTKNPFKTMKKTLYYIGAMLLAITSLTSCEKDLMDFEGEESLYFDARWYASHIDQDKWPHRLHTQVAFGNISEDEVEIVVPIRTTGEVKDYDREFNVEIVADSTTAVEGREFSDLKTNCVIKAGQLTDTIKFKAHRTENIHRDTLCLQLRVLPNKHFTTNFVNYNENGSYFQFVTVGGSQSIKAFDRTTDARLHNIFFYDCMVQPAGWWKGIGGDFTEKKLKLMCEVCGVEITEFETQANMPSIRFTAYCEKFGKYLIEQAKLGIDHAVRDEDGTMMYVPYVASGDYTFRWGPNTKPEDCPFYKK